jgi:hypothetical protein
LNKLSRRVNLLLYGLANASADVIVFISALNKYSPRTAAPALVPPLS